MEKILYTFLFTMIAYVISLIFIWAFYLIFVVYGEVEKPTLVGLVLLFVAIFAVIYHFGGV